MTKTIATLFISILGNIVFCINGEYWLDSFYVDGTVTQNVESWREIPSLSNHRDHSEIISSV